MFIRIVALLIAVSGAIGSPISGRIVNGTNALEGEIPYIVSVRIAGGHSCGGSILDATHVLTAAHCAIYSSSFYTIQYGLVHIVPGFDASNVIRVKKIISHEDYTPSKGYINDIAVVVLESPIPLGPNAQPIKLPKPLNGTPENAVALLSGWGYGFSGGLIIEDLQKVNILVYPDAECERIHAQTGPTNRNFHICAGVPEGGKGQCSGDSGGPLVVDGIQVGVVSWSVKPCTIQGYPGVFTKVSRHVDWIFDKINA